MKNQKPDAKEMQNALLQSRERYERLANAVPVMLYDSILAQDGTSRFLYVAPEPCLEILELDPEALLKDMSLVWNIIHPEDLSRFHQEDLTANQAGKEFVSEVRIITRSGQLKWLLVNSKPNPSVPGEPVVWSGYLQDITARKQTEARLRETEQKLRLIVENSTNLFYMHTPDHILTYVSPQSRQFFDCEPEEAMGRWAEFLTDHPENSGAVLITQRAIDTGQPQPSYQIECIGKQGRKIWVEVNETPITEHGRTVAISGTLTDITKRRQAQKEREQFFKFFQTSADLMTMADDEGRFIKVNPAFSEALGYRESEVIAKQWLEFAHPDDIRATLDEITRQQQTGFTDNFENRYICKDGSIKWLSWRATFSSKDRIVYATARDITEKKQAEETLRESRNLLQTILENIPIRVFWKDRDLNYLGCNTAFARSAGFADPKDLLGKNDIQMCWQDRAEMYRADDRRVIDTETSEIGLEKPLTAPDGQTIWIRTSKVPLYDTEKKVIGMLGIDEDITEQKKKGEEKAKLESHLRQSQKIESIGRLAGGVAHDYNNMLSVILGYAELAQMKMAPTDPVQEDLEHILSATKRSRDITQQLLAFARKQTVSPQVIDFNDAVEGMLKMLRKLVGEDINISWQPNAGAGKVEMDPSQLDQVLANLCVNARDAIADVGKLIIETDRVRLDPNACENKPGLAPGDFVLLTVSDNGCGMDEEILERIFEPFFTTKERGTGTGLGLATVYGIVQQSDGHIDVSSKLGVGTTFKIYLPRLQKEHTHKKPEMAIEVPKGQGETILLVEDEEAILKLVQTILENLNYRVLVAITPSAAISLVKTHADEIHMLVTDVIMPGMNGKELFDCLQALRPDLQCLYMSGYTDEKLAPYGMLDESIHFIQKPFSRDDLAIQIRHALQSGR